MTHIKCHHCNGRGVLVLPDETVATKYGEHTIEPDWKKVDGVFIWFEDLKKPNGKWHGIPGYVYETSIGEYLAPFRGSLIKVIKDTRNEFREWHE